MQGSGVKAPQGSATVTAALIQNDENMAPTTGMVTPITCSTSGAPPQCESSGSTPYTEPTFVVAGEGNTNAVAPVPFHLSGGTPTRQSSSLRPTAEV